MAAGGAQASNAGGDGGQGMEDVCAGLPTQRKESNICPISNATLGSSGTELLVRRKLTFSCVYELSLWFTLGLIFSPHSSLLLQSAILHFKGNNIFLHFLLCWDFFLFISEMLLKMNRISSPHLPVLYLFLVTLEVDVACPCFWGTRDIHQGEHILLELAKNT